MFTDNTSFLVLGGYAGSADNLFEIPAASDTLLKEVSGVAVDLQASENAWKWLGAVRTNTTNILNHMVVTSPGTVDVTSPLSAANHCAPQEPPGTPGGTPEFREAPHGAGALARLDEALPTVSMFHGARPMPFRDGVQFAVGAGGTQQVSIDVFDVRGRRVQQVLNSVLVPGNYLVAWNGMDTGGLRVASGVYFARFVAGDVVQSKKLVKVR
jgi:hypothetical protein